MADKIQSISIFDICSKYDRLILKENLSVAAIAGEACFESQWKTKAGDLLEIEVSAVGEPGTGRVSVFAP